MGVLSTLDQNKRDCQPHRDGSVCRPGYYYMYCAEHSLHGHGALSHDRTIWGGAFCWKPGKKTNVTDCFTFFLNASCMTQHSKNTALKFFFFFFADIFVVFHCPKFCALTTKTQRGYSYRMHSCVEKQQKWNRMQVFF